MNAPAPIARLVPAGGRRLTLGCPSLLASLLCGATASCATTPASPPAASVAAAEGATTFEADLAFLGGFDHPQVLESPGAGRIAVSTKYQGRVMTSAVEPGGRSLGFVNRAFIQQGKTSTAFDNYGGEDRFWLGPEAGQFGLYFPPGKPFQFAHWQTPHELQEGAWNPRVSSPSSITLAKDMTVMNYAGTRFQVGVERRVSLLSRREAESRLGLALPPSVKWVGFATANTITNRGAAAWVEQSGLPSVWILGMFAPVPGTHVIVPFRTDASGPVVNDAYFGKVPADRLVVHERDGFLSFTCDGQLRSKIGVPPARAKPALGSYAERGGDANLLTLVLYSKPAGAMKYVNSLWELQKDPYGGDVVNSYNDGPTEPGKPSLGGFYEIESSSPAAALDPGASLTHTHETFHITGPRADLDALARKVLGVSLDQVP